MQQKKGQCLHPSIFFLDFLKKKNGKRKEKLRQVPSYRVPSRIRIRIASPDANILHSADTCIRYVHVGGTRILDSAVLHAYLRGY